MQIKAADDKQPDLDALAALLERPDVAAPTRRQIEQEIRRMRAGAAGERDAAYQIDFHYGASRNYVTIHDLRLEVGDRVAQIDHLVLTRLLDIWVLESKHFADGVAVNDHGEWSALYGRSERGMPSPVEQNRRHVMVLDDLFAKGSVHLPKRLGLVTIRPRIRSLILVSDNARIVRPRSRAAAAQVDGLDTVIKSEQLRATIDNDFDQRSSASILKAIGEETLETVGRDLAAQHRPMTMDWAARFGLQAVATPAPLVVAPVVEPTSGAAPGVCAECGRPVSKGIIDFCATYPRRFGGRTLCITCQRRKGGVAPAEKA